LAETVAGVFEFVGFFQAAGGLLQTQFKQFLFGIEDSVGDVVIAHLPHFGDFR
jgi:hypothetical protein